MIAMAVATHRTIAMDPLNNSFRSTLSAMPPMTGPKSANGRPQSIGTIATRIGDPVISNA